MNEPTIICPNCKTEIKLTESLAAPLMEATREDSEQRLAQKESDIARHQAALAKAMESVEQQVAERVNQERTNIAADETRKAKLAAQADLEQKAKKVAELQEFRKQREAKLVEAQNAEAMGLRKQRELDDAEKLFKDKRARQKTAAATAGTGP